MGCAIPRHSRSSQPRRVRANHVRTAAPPRLGRTARRTQSGYSRDSRSGAGTPRLRTTTSSFRHRRSGCVEMVEPSRFRLTLEEPPVAVDPTSSQKSEQLPSFNAYSVDGDVTGPLVYVNYGRARRLRGTRSARHLRQRRDRDRALRRVLARYQAEGGGRARRDRLPDVFRILETMGTGSMACFRMARCARRTACSAGSVMDIPTYPGDPTTPGRGSTAGDFASRVEGRHDAHENPCPADFVRRRATAAGCTHWRCRPRWTGAVDFRLPIALVLVPRACT